MHLISNNGTAAANITATVQVIDAEALFCGSSGGCSSTTNALVSIGAADNEVGSCTGLPTSGTYNNVTTYNTNGTAALCNSLAFLDANDQIKTWVAFQVPRDATTGAKSLVIVYEAIAT